MVKDEYGEWAIRVRTKVINTDGSTLVAEHIRHERGSREGAKSTVRSREKATLRVDHPTAPVREIEILGMVLEIPE
jgi:hypothetical protein